MGYYHTSSSSAAGPDRPTAELLLTQPTLWIRWYSCCLKILRNLRENRIRPATRTHNTTATLDTWIPGYMDTWILGYPWSTTLAYSRISTSQLLLQLLHRLTTATTVNFKIQILWILQMTTRTEEWLQLIANHWGTVIPWFGLRQARTTSNCYNGRSLPPSNPSPPPYYPYHYHYYHNLCYYYHHIPPLPPYLLTPFHHAFPPSCCGSFLLLLCTPRQKPPPSPPPLLLLPCSHLLRNFRPSSPFPPLLFHHYHMQLPLPRFYFHNNYGYLRPQTLPPPLLLLLSSSYYLFQISI